MWDPVGRRAVRRSHGTWRAPEPLVSRPRVSVIIPCYNYGHFLAGCVQSALDHDDVDIEVIIVDDASPDGSGDVAEAIAATDPRVSVIRHRENKRHLATYNDGFAAATGDYLVQLSADDLLPRNSLTRALALLEARPDVGFAYGYAAHFRGTPPPADGDVDGWITWAGRDWIETRCRYGFNVIQTTEVVMRTEVVRSVGAYRLDLPHSGDLELWMRMATVSDVGFVAGPPQAFYRLHETNMHTSTFGQGTTEGEFIDMSERWLAFRALFEASSAQALPDAGRLESVARRTFALEALGRANYAFARGKAAFPVDRFEQFAMDLDPTVVRTSAARALARRKRVGMTTLPVHPLWAPHAVARRTRGSVLRWRRRRVGI